MEAVGGERQTVRIEAMQNSGFFFAPDSPEGVLDLLEMAGAIGVLREKIVRVRALGLLYGGQNGGRFLGAMNLVARIDEHRLRGEGLDGRAIARGEGFDRTTAFGTPMIRFQSGQNDASRHA